MAENEGKKDVSTAIKDISQVSVQVARQPTEKVPTLKFLASQVPMRGTIPEELCINLNQIATALKEVAVVEMERDSTEPIKCLGSQIPRINILDDDTENEGEMAEEPQNLKFLASQIPRVPQNVAEDFGSEVIGNTRCSTAEEHTEAIKCLGSQIPKSSSRADNNIENEGEMTDEEPQNLKFLASQIPQIPQEVTKDYGGENESYSSAEEQPEEVKCQGSQIPQAEMLSVSEESQIMMFEREDLAQISQLE